MAPASNKIERSRIPSGRGERLVKLGWLAGRMAVGAASEGARRIVGGRPGQGHVLLTESNARMVADSLSTMRGAAMKLGQLLSLEAEDMLPPAAAEALATLRDAGDAMPREQLESVLRDSWGDDWVDHFELFDFEPIAAASIGQVHTGVTRDGRELALKIQYPGVARSIDSDVDNLAMAFRLARILPGEIDFQPLVDEAKRQLHDESNYQTEAGFLKRYRVLLSDEEEIVVPEVHDDLSTRSILAMDRLHGLPLEDLCGADHADAERDRMGTHLIRLVLREFFEFHFIQSDPNFANFLLLKDGRLGLIDLGAGYEAPLTLCREYARMFRAALDDDRLGLHDAALEIGFIEEDDPPQSAKLMIDLIMLATEPFRFDGTYDFGRTDLPTRAREAATRLVIEHAFWRPPPPETLFLQRKLGGIFLLCSKLRARVPARRLLEDALAGVRGV